MATYYWFGGTGSWDATTTHWSLTSGNTGGVLAPNAPTSADDVIFDNLSNPTAYTVTLTTPTCRSVTGSGPASGNVTIIGSATWSIYGSMTFASAGITRSNTGAITFAATTPGWTITAPLGFSNSFIFSGVGGTWTLGAALSCGQGLTVSGGSLDTAGYSLSCNGITSTGTNVRAISFGSSAISTSGINFSGANLTFNAGTSTISVAGAISPNITVVNGTTFYNMSLTRNSTDATTTTITGACSFNNLTLSANATGVQSVAINSSITINGVLSGGGNNIIQRLFLRSSALGSPATITVAASTTMVNTDFRDITVSGATITSAVGCGDCGGNSGVTFPAAKTVYWNLAGSQNWSATGWATTQTGTPNLANFPLAQDTALFTNTNPGASAVITSNAGFNVGTIDFSARTVALTYSSGSATVGVYGDTVLSSALTIGGAAGLQYLGRGNTQLITSAGRTWSQSMTVLNIGGTVRLTDACTRSSTATVTNGTFDLNGYALTCSTFTSSVSNTRALAFGATGSITVTSTGTVFNTTTTTGLTVTGTDPKVYVTYAGVNTTTISTGTTVGVSNLFSFYFTAGTYSLTLTAPNLFNNLDFTGFSGLLGNNGRSIYGNLKLSSGMTCVAGPNVTTFAATSTGKTITSNGQTMDFPVTFNGAGGSWILQDAMTIGSTRAFTLTNGTIDLNGFTCTLNTFLTATGTKNLTFNGGTLNVTGTPFNNAAPTNFTTTAGTGAGTISLTSASAKTFTGGGSTYNCTLNQGGAGTLTISGNNTFNDITNTVQPTTVTFTASSTNTFANFNLNGTAGNLVTINSSIAGTRANLVKTGADVSCDYLNIKDSAAS